MTIYIASDIHGSAYRERLDDPALASLTKDDLVIVLGDLEMIDEDPAHREVNIAWLESRPFTTAFIDGNHEEYAVLERYPAEQWCGGRVRRIAPSVVQLMRGQVFELEGARFFAMGGAPTFQRARLLGLLTDPDPGMPSAAEIAEAEANLECCGWRVDYVLTHCAPNSIASVVLGGGHVFDNELSLWLQSVAERLEFQHWAFGHYHTDLALDPQVTGPLVRPDGCDAARPAGDFRCIFNQLYRVGDGALLREPMLFDPAQRRRRRENGEHTIPLPKTSSE